MVGWRGVLMSLAGDGSPGQTASTPTQGFGCEPLLFLLYNGVLYLWFDSPEEHNVHYLWKIIVHFIGRAGRAGHARCAGRAGSPPRLDAATYFRG